MKERNLGIDFLRIISMFMIVILHILGEGGILEYAEDYSSCYWSAWFLEIAAYCAVNCFALISGYVMLNSKNKISKLLELWIQIVFYTIGITIIMFFLFPQTRSVNNLINAIFPITKRQYWYLSSYFAMYIFIPVMNIGINKLDKKTLKSILISVFFMMSFFPTLLISDPYKLSGGYSTIWLCILYMAGGYIKKYNVCEKIKKGTAINIFCGAIIFTFLTKVAIVYGAKIILGINKSGEILVSYTSPTIILAALSLFVFCEKLKFKENIENIIKLISPAALGVYLIHVHPLIYYNLISNFFVRFIDHNCFIMTLKVIGSAIIIYVMCSVVELVRIKIFKLLKVNELCSKIDKIEIFE